MKDYKNTIFNIIGKLDNGSHSSSQLQAVDEELQELVEQIISERDKEWVDKIDRLKVNKWGIWSDRDQDIYDVKNMIVEEIKQALLQTLNK